MPPSVSVKCSGALYSSLIFELMKHSKSQEGFFLGDIKEVTSHSISDSEIRNENTSIIINVASFIPCSSLGSFYSGSGGVKPDLLKACIGKDWERVVGWYRYRGSCEEVYLREMRVHRQLREIMSHTGGNFLLAIISAIPPADSGTLDIEYKFHIMQPNLELEGSHLDIVNMTDTSTSQFIREAHSSSLYDSGGLTAILENIVNFEPGVFEAQQLHSGLVNRLKEILPKYAAVQEKHHKTMKEVAKLQAFCHSAGLISDFQPRCVRICDSETASKSPVLATRSRKLLNNGVSEKNLQPARKRINSANSEIINNVNENEFKNEQSFEVDNKDSVTRQRSVINVTKDKSMKKTNRAQSSPRIESPKPKSLKGRVRRSSSGSSPIKGEKDRAIATTSVIPRQNAAREIKVEVVDKTSPRKGRKFSPSTKNIAT